MGNIIFIVWRESIEAMLVIGILYAWLSSREQARTGLHFLWGGVWPPASPWPAYWPW